METLEKIQNGIYKRSSSIFIVKDNLILMRANGKFYKITLDKMIGASFESELTDLQVSQFDALYLSSQIW